VNSSTTIQDNIIFIKITRGFSDHCDSNPKTPDLEHQDDCRPESLLWRNLPMGVDATGGLTFWGGSINLEVVLKGAEARGEKDTI
jgi:hypothetical protein